MPPDDTATQWREELSRTAVTASAADAAVKTHERVWSANFFYEEWKPVEGGRVIYGFKGADAEQRLRDRIAELKNEDIWGAPLSRPFLDRVIETASKWAGAGARFYEVACDKCPGVSKYISEYYAQCGTVLDEKQALHMTSDDMLILAAALLLYTDMKAIIIVPGIAELESRSLFVSNYAPIVEGGPEKQKYGFASASQYDIVTGLRMAASLRVTGLLCQQAYREAMRVGLVPDNLLSQMTDFTDVVPDAAFLYESDNPDRRASGVAAKWVQEAATAAKARDEAAQLLLCSLGESLRSRIEGVFVNNGIAVSQRKQCARVLCIMQAADTRNSLLELEALRVLSLNGFGIKDASLVPAAETALNAGTRANMQCTGGLYILCAQHRYRVMFKFLVRLWTEAAAVPPPAVPPPAPDFLACRIEAHALYPLDTAHGLMMHERLRGAAGSKAAHRAQAALNANPNMTLKAMAELLASGGVDMEASVEEWLAAQSEDMDT